MCQSEILTETVTDWRKVCPSMEFPPLLIGIALNNFPVSCPIQIWNSSLNMTFFFPVIHHPRLIFLRLCLPFLFVCLGVNDGFWLAFQNVNSILYFMQFPPICFAAHFLFYVKSVICFFSTHLNNWMDILRDWWFNFPGAVYWLLITFLLHNTSTVFTMIHVFKKNIEWFYYIQIIFFHWSIRIWNICQHLCLTIASIKKGCQYSLQINDRSLTTCCAIRNFQHNIYISVRAAFLQ